MSPQAYNLGQKWFWPRFISMLLYIAILINSGSLVKSFEGSYGSLIAFVVSSILIIGFIAALWSTAFGFWIVLDVVVARTRRYIKDGEC